MLPPRFVRVAITSCNVNNYYNMPIILIAVGPTCITRYQMQLHVPFPRVIPRDILVENDEPFPLQCYVCHIGA